jgi:hypothetical protein
LSQKTDEFNATYASFIGVSSTLIFDSSKSWLWYGNNGNFYNNSAYTVFFGNYAYSNRMSFLIKQPEGKLWIAKDGVWINSGNPELDLNITQQLDANQQYFPATGTTSGSTTNFHFSYDDWLYYDDLMSWLK